MTADAASGQEPIGEEKSVTMSLDEAIEFAITCQRTGRFPVAERIYQEVLARLPDHGRALHFYGILKNQTGDAEGAARMIERSLEVEPGFAGGWNNYGNILIGLNRRDEAIDALKRCIEIDPGFADAYNNLGVVQRAKRNLDIAASCYEKAIALRPDFADAYNNFANLRMMQGKLAEAVSLAFKAFTLRPQNTEARRMLGYAYAQLGETEKARECYQAWLADEPDNPIPKHHLAALTEGAAPPRASDDYVRTIFDSFANDFDTKLASLDYKAPEHTAEAVREIFGAPQGTLSIADGGCGTGLCGPLLKPFARSLVGVDLSPLMVDKARPRQCYDELVVGELTQFFKDRPEAFDLVVSADTLCYFGDLDEVLRACAGSLKTGGVLIFTVEHYRDAPEEFHLYQHGRYGHGANYLRRALGGAGFEMKPLRSLRLRMESGVPVEGFLVVASKAG